LVGALRELAARHTCPSFAVSVTANELGELTAATEVAAYAIVAEALTNAGRHAAATRCVITLKRKGDELAVGVDDDGVGLNDAPAGLGRTSMIERSEELGGWCRVSTSKVRGTSVEAHLPARITSDDRPRPAHAIGPRS
jgi:signal transduction histidine kinase